MGMMHTLITIASQRNQEIVKANSCEGTISLFVCVVHKAGCRWMYRTKVLPGLFSGRSTQRPDTENTGGV